MDQEVLPRKSTRQYQENTCNVCHNQFSLSNRSIICSKCFQKACKLHITTENHQPFCEACIRIELKKDYTQKSHDTITSLRNEFRSLQHREKANMKEIAVKTESISKLNQSIKSQQELYNTRLREIEELIAEETQNIDLCNSQILQFTRGIDSSNTTHKSEQEKFANAMTELIKVQKDHGIVVNEHDQLKEQADRLQEENEKMITFQRIRTTTCNRCYREMILRFHEQIINILSRKEKTQLIASVLAVKYAERENLTVSSCKCVLF